VIDPNEMLELMAVGAPEGEYDGWKLDRLTLEGLSIERIRHMALGRDTPDGTYTRLIMPDGNVMMSDTYAERIDAIPILTKMIRRGGDVLINGLGIGMMLPVLIASPEITHIDVVEKEAAVIALVGDYYRGLAGEKLTIHHADAFDIEWSVLKSWSVAWHDIWPYIDSSNLPEMIQLEAKYQDRVTYQESWLRDDCEAQQELDDAIENNTPPHELSPRAFAMLQSLRVAYSDGPMLIRLEEA